MSLYETWASTAFDKDGQSVDAVWNEYLVLEQKIYEDILSNKITNISGKLSDLAVQYNMSDVYFTGFCDGISGALEEEIDASEFEETTDISLKINFESLYKKMVEYKVPHLYNLPQWDNIFPQDEQKRLMLEQKKSSTVTRTDEKIGRNDPCPCGSGKKYKKCCGNQ